QIFEIAAKYQAYTGATCIDKIYNNEMPMPVLKSEGFCVLILQLPVRDRTGIFTNFKAACFFSCKSTPSIGTYPKNERSCDGYEKCCQESPHPFFLLW